MDPASFQPGSAPIEYQVQVPSSSPSSHDPPYLSRPISRLGFNKSTSLETIASSVEADATEQQEPQDTRGLHQSLNQGGISPTLRLPSLLSDNCTLSDGPAPSSSLDSPETTGKDTSTDSEYSIFSNATGDVIKTNSADNDSLYGGHIDRASSAPVSASMSCTPNKPRPSSPPSVSRLCFPFVTSASRRKKAPPVRPPPRHKYSCNHPTLMAPYHTGKAFPVHQRHQYSHRGHSHQGMERVKALWSMKFAQELPEGQSDSTSTEDQRSKALARLAALYDMDQTVVEMPATIHPLASQESQNAQHQLPPMTVHPRRGDIVALRDPYCMQIDRQFVNLPTWTIGKTIWMQDMHIASEKRQAQSGVDSQADNARALSSASSDRGEDEDVLEEDGVSTDAESEIDVETSLSTSFSDDSDATLVESESEPDLSQLGSFKAGNAFYQWASAGSSSSRRPISSSNPTMPAASSQAFGSITSPFSTSSSDVNSYSLRPSPLSASSGSSISDMMADTEIDVDLLSLSQAFYTSNFSSDSLLVETYHQSHERNEETEDEDEASSMTPPTTPTAPKSPTTPVCTWAPRQSWQTNWYTRWQLLVDLTRKERNRKYGSPRSCPTTPVTDGPLKGQKFFINSAHSDDEDESDGLEQKWRTRSRGRAISA